MSLSASDYRKIMSTMINKQSRGSARTKTKAKTRGRGIVGGKKNVNPWVKFVKDFAKKNNMSYKDSLQYASAYYHGF